MWHTITESARERLPQSRSVWCGCFYAMLVSLICVWPSHFYIWGIVTRDERWMPRKQTASDGPVSDDQYIWQTMFKLIRSYLIGSQMSRQWFRYYTTPIWLVVPDGIELGMTSQVVIGNWTSHLSRVRVGTFAGRKNNVLHARYLHPQCFQRNFPHRLLVLQSSEGRIMQVVESDW